METFQTRSSFRDESDRTMTLQCCCEKTKSICSGITFQLRVLFRWKKTFPYPLFIHPAPIRRYNYIKVSHIPLIRNTIFTISTHCVGERLSRWPGPASPPPTPSASSAARIRTLLWLLQDRFWKFHTNPRHVTIVCPQEIICQDPLVVFYHDILTQKEIKYMQSTELVTFLSWMLILI